MMASRVFGLKEVRKEGIAEANGGAAAPPPASDTARARVLVSSPLSGFPEANESSPSLTASSLESQ